MTPSRMIVSICGPAGAGKSQLAKAVAATLGADRCSRIPTDYFLMLPARRDDHPTSGSLRYEWPLIDSLLSHPLGTTVTTPDVDFDCMVRRSLTGGLPFVVRPIVLTDALAPHPAAALRILLTAPDTVRRDRIAARDVVWNSRVIDRWSALEHTWSETVASQFLWNLELSGEDRINANAQVISRVLEDQVKT